MTTEIPKFEYWPILNTGRKSLLEINTSPMLQEGQDIISWIQQKDQEQNICNILNILDLPFHDQASQDNFLLMQKHDLRRGFISEFHVPEGEFPALPIQIILLAYAAHDDICHNLNQEGFKDPCQFNSFRSLLNYCASEREQGAVDITGKPLQGDARFHIDSMQLLDIISQAETLRVWSQSNGQMINLDQVQVTSALNNLILRIRNKDDFDNIQKLLVKLWSNPDYSPSEIAKAILSIKCKLTN